jgi:hypothetical protein
MRGQELSNNCGNETPMRGIIGDEAVTFGRTSPHHSFHAADRYSTCGNWNGIAPLISLAVAA